MSTYVKTDKIGYTNTFNGIKKEKKFVMYVLNESFRMIKDDLSDYFTWQLCLFGISLTKDMN